MPKERPAELAKALLALADQPETIPEIRVQALALMPGGLSEVTPERFALLCKLVRRDQPPGARSAAATALGRATLTSAQFGELADLLPEIGPLELDRVLECFEKNKEEAVGLRVLAALKQAPATANLRPEMIPLRLKSSGSQVQDRAKEFVATLAPDAAKQRERLEELLPMLAKGDARRGQLVFNAAKNACVACHAIGYVGGKIGPDLTRIGQIRTERDLLESIVFPSMTLVQGFQPLLIETKDGRVYNGLVKQETSDEIVLTTGVDQEVRVPRAQIEESQPGRVSIMPAGLDKQLSPQELADLVAFLKTCAPR
jgi:putative heme-binding domain-containing protein